MHRTLHVLCSKNYYRIPDAEAAEIVKYINIYHPYGSVGSLPWFDNGGSVEFGAEPNAEQLLKLAGKIKTFTEGTDPDSSDILQIKRHMSETKRLVFMGFAFHKLNMQVLIVSGQHKKILNSHRSVMPLHTLFLKAIKKLFVHTLLTYMD